MRNPPPCTDWIGKLAFRRADLSSSEQAALDAHLRTCAACAAAAADYQLLIARIRALPEPTVKPLPHLLHQEPPQFADFLTRAAPTGQEAPELPGEDELTTPTVIPRQYYARVLDAYTTTPHAVRFWSLSNLILRQALVQLDVRRVGLSLTMALCMPPSSDGTIHSLHESVGIETFSDLEEKNLLLGGESLAGHAITACRPIIQNVGEDQRFPPTRPDEKSSGAFPILFVGKIAGCLLVSSTQPDWFASSPTTALLQQYSQLVTLALNAEDFYDPRLIELHVMPPPEVQEKHFADFGQRVASALKQAMREGRPIRSVDAEMMVRKQLEEEFSRLSLPEQSLHTSDMH